MSAATQEQLRRPAVPDGAVLTSRDRLRLALTSAGERLAGTAMQVFAALLGLLGSVAVAIAAVGVGPLPKNRPQPWIFELPRSWLTSPTGQTWLTVLFYLGLGLVAVAWLLVGIGVHAGHWRVRWLVVLAMVWVIPWVLGPVALSTDVYTYLGQGLVAHAGLDPYTHGPASANLPIELDQRISAVWLHTPSPYGPGFMGLDSLVASVARNHVVLAVLIIRVVNLLGLGLAALCLPRVARRAGADPARALWLGVLSPLALGATALSGHNDALMAGLLVAALALLTVRHRFAGPAAVAVATLAATIKLPGAVGVVVLGLAWAAQGSTPRYKRRRVGLAILIALVVTVAVSVVTGVGADWINLAAITTPENVTPNFTPVAAVSQTLTSIAGAVGGHLDQAVVLSIVRLAADAFIAVFAVAVLWQQERIGAVRSLGVILAAVVLASPVTWPWYLLWPVMLLGACAVGRTRPVWIALAASVLFLTEPDGIPHLLGPAAAAVLAVLSVLAALGSGIWAYRGWRARARADTGFWPAKAAPALRRLGVAIATDRRLQGLCGLGFVLACVTFWLAHGALGDDGYISLDYARTFALHGRWGLTPDLVSNSATSPLNVLLLGGVMALDVLFTGQAHPMVALGVVMALAMVATAAWWSALSRRLGVSFLAAALGLAVVLLSP
ncbi:MAG: polyprenol phosphomannose-dependent alpha 1,6 mannosyltransferase MptB, partial [Sciscionella sp.]